VSSMQLHQRHGLLRSGNRDLPCVVWRLLAGLDGGVTTAYGRHGMGLLRQVQHRVLYYCRWIYNVAIAVHW